MKILFKNKTKYTKELYDKFLEFHSEKFGFKNTFYILFIGILLLCCSIFYAYNNYWIQSLLFIVILVGFLFYEIVRPLSEVKQDMQSDKITKQKTFKFIFCENYFKIYNNLQYEKIKYYKLYKIFETSDYFYFYIDKDHSLLMDKKGFYFGTSDEFSKFINRKYWYKYQKIRNDNR